MSPVLRAASLIACLCAVQAPGAAAQAQTRSPVDEGRRLFEQADFYGALEALREAEASSALDLEELTRLYETRILVHLALGERGQIHRDLAALATIRPDHGLGAEVPPAVRDDFRTLVGQRAGPLGVVIEPQASDGQLLLSARVVGDPDGLVREARLYARVDGGRWASASDTLRVAAEPGERVEHYVELVGPGGAVLRQRGSATDPLVWQASSGGEPLAFGAGSATHEGGDDGGDGVGWGWWLAGGAAVAIGAAVLIFVLASNGDAAADGTAVRGPTVMGF